MLTNSEANVPEQKQTLVSRGHFEVVNLSSSHSKKTAIHSFVFILKKSEGHWDSGTTTHSTQQINSCSVVYKRKRTFFLIFFSLFTDDWKGTTSWPPPRGDAKMDRTTDSQKSWCWPKGFLIVETDLIDRWLYGDFLDLKQKLKFQSKYVHLYM